MNSFPISNSYQTKSMSFFESILFLLIFVAPFTLCTITPLEYNSTIQVCTTISYFIVLLFRPEILRQILSGPCRNLIAVYILCVLVKFVAYGAISFHSILMPIAASIGYYYIKGYRIDARVFDLYLLGLYVYFYFSYFSHLPSLIFRGHFDDGAWFGGASSNAIPIAIINILYIYSIISYFQGERNRKKLLLFSLGNFVLVLIQQSRIGIILSGLMLIYFYFYYSQNKSKAVRYVPILIVLSVCAFYLRYYFVDLTEQIGVIGVQAYEEDCRKAAVQYFFDHMGVKEFLVGYPPGTEFFPDIDYTYNMWLEHWNKYTFIGFALIILVFLNRFIKSNKYYFPLLYFVPLLIYGYVEPRYLPNFWDFFIYLLLFTKK